LINLIIINFDDKRLSGGHFYSGKSKRMSYGFRKGGKSEGVIGNSRKPVSIMPFLFQKY